MNRFLRKYSKLLLAVFGTGLMVVFLMPQIPELVSRFGAESTLVATMGEDGHKISAQDWEEIRQEMQFFDRMRGDQLLPPLPLLPGGELQSPDQYYLLVHEASKAGMIGGAITSGLTNESSLELARLTGFPPALIRQALTNRAGIARYLGSVITASQQSDRRLRGEGRRLFDAADTQIAAVRATTPSTEEPPSAEALQQHFETYRDVEPGEGEHGFGYRQPDRLRLEWIRIPANAIDDSLRASDAMNDRELMKFWRRNESQYPGFEDAVSIPDSVRDGLLNDLREDYRGDIRRAVNDSLRLPRRGFEEAGGYLILPEDWMTRQVSFEDLRAMLQDRFTLDLEAPQSSGDEMIALAEVDQLEGIGRARATNFGRQSVSLGQLAAETKEFGGTGMFPIQAGIAGPVLEDASQDMFVFRITDAEGDRPAASLDEVRTQIETDLLRLAHYQELLEELDDMETVSRAEGLEAFADRWNGDQPSGKVFQKYSPGTIGFYLSNGLQPQASPASLPGLSLEDEQVVNDILAHTTTLDDSADLETLEESDRVIVLPSEENLAVVAVRLVGRRPLDRDAYQQLSNQQVIPLLLLNEELGGDIQPLRDSFTPEQLRDRNGFEYAGDDDESADNGNGNGTATN